MNMCGLIVALAALVAAAAMDRQGGKVDRASGAGAPPGLASAPPAAVEAALAHLHEEVRPGAAGSLAIVNGAYHASFSADDGVVYTPRHEGRLDRRLTWRYRARTIATDTVSRRLDAVTPVVSPTGDHVVDFVRPGLVERYEGEPRGVEQIFVLTEHPAGAGDVRIAGEVAFDGTVRPEDGGLVFDPGDGLPTFAYAKPVAFDADRRPVPVRVEAHGASLTLVLEEEALAQAAWPVTIDPLFGSTLVAEGKGLYSDLAYNWRRGEFLVVYQLMWASSDGEAPAIRGRRFADHGAAIGPSFLIADGASGSLWETAAAYDLHTDRYLVVWHRALPQLQARQVEGRLLNTVANPLGASFAISAAYQSVGRVDVAARNFEEHTAADPSFLVVWEAYGAGASWSIYRERIRGDGTQLGELMLSAGAGPAVAFDPHTDRFLVAYQNTEATAVVARSIAASGATSAEISIASSATPAIGAPRVAYDLASRRFMVGWVESPPSPPWIYRARFLSSGVPPTPAGSSFVLLQLGDDERGGFFDVASEVGTFVTAHNSSVFSGPSNVRLRRWRASDGLFLGERAVGAGDHSEGGRLAFGRHGFLPLTFNTFDGTYQQRLALYERWFARGVHGRSGDLDGDGRSDLFLFQQATSLFFARTQSTTSSYVFGIPGGVPVILDIDGDDRADLGVWEPSTGPWWIRRSSDSQVMVPVLGSGGDIPVPGDYQGTGADRIAVFRPSTATWFIKTAHPFPVSVQFGQPGDLPVPADWNGDGDVELGVWRPSTGTWHAAELDGTPVPIPSTPWGGPGDLPLAGNFTGGPHADQVVYRRQLGVVYRRDGATGTTATIQVGQTGLPTPLDWDGDGRLEIAMFHAEAGEWRINDASGTVVTFGTIGDLPAGAP